MLPEKLPVSADVLQLRPAAGLHRVGVQVVDFRALHGQQERRVAGDYKLAAVKSYAVL